jgi:polar amino acid transport system permease protein
MDFSWVPEFSGLLLEGLFNTVAILVLSGTIGFALALVIGFGRVSRSPFIALPCLAFTSVIRGTPLLVQIFLLYYGLGSLFAAIPAIRDTWIWGILKNGFWYVVAALAISTGGYGAELIRAALRAVPKGELEAGRVFGMSGLLLLRRIWLPRALQGILPTLAGETVLLLKSTALAFTVTVVDLMGAANKVRAVTFRTYEPLLFVAVGYLLMTLIIERGFRGLERRYARAYRR